MKRFHLLFLLPALACKDTRVSQMNETIAELKTQLDETRSYVGIDEEAAAAAATTAAATGSETPDGQKSVAPGATPAATAQNTTQTAATTATDVAQQSETAEGQEPQKQSLRAKIASLETEIATLKGQVAATKSRQVTAKRRTGATNKRAMPKTAGMRRGATARPPTQQQEAQAQQLFKQITNFMGNNQFAQAKQKQQLMKRSLSNTRIYKAAQKSVFQELDLIGQRSPVNIQSKKWFHKKGPVDLTKGVTIVLFGESWCKECITEFPKINAIFNALKKKGLKTVALSRLSNNSTEKQLKDFIKKYKLDFPVALDAGQYSQYFKVKGIPAAAIIKDGKVVWRGHTKSLTNEKVAAFLN